MVVEYKFVIMIVIVIAIVIVIVIVSYDWIMDDLMINRMTKMSINLRYG